MVELLTAWNGAILGQADAEAARSAVQIQSIWDFVVKGGPMMIPIAISSLVALTVIIERVVSLRRKNVAPDGFLEEVRFAMGDDGDDRGEALEFCGRHGSPIATICGTAIRRLHEPIDLLERHIQEAGEREVIKLRRFLRSLSVIAAIAPLMGLLGTIFGMIKAFQTVATSGDALGKAEMLATGIYEAMITTAAGLLVAIPTLIAYHWISARIDRHVTEIDRVACDFVEEYATNVPYPDGAAALRTVSEGDDGEDEAARSAVASA